MVVLVSQAQKAMFTFTSALITVFISDVSLINVASFSFSFRLYAQNIFPASSGLGLRVSVQKAHLCSACLIATVLNRRQLTTVGCLCPVRLTLADVTIGLFVRLPESNSETSNHSCYCIRRRNFTS